MSPAEDAHRQLIERLPAVAETLTELGQLALAAGRPEIAAELFRVTGWLVGAVRGLSAAPKSRTLTQVAQPEAAEPRRRGRPTKSKHPFPLALEAAGTTVAEWARENDLEREVVKSWFAPGDAGRRIPALWAQRIARQFKSVPATDAVWKNGIR